MIRASAGVVAKPNAWRAKPLLPHRQPSSP
jgi:hypothetical protein